MRMIAQPMTYRFSVEEYHKLGEVGILGEDDRIELLDGELTIMSPIGSPHFATLNRLAALFFQCLAGRCIISQQNPVRLDQFSEPQPDIALLETRADFYGEDLPNPSSVFLLVEVADSSLHYDRAKLRLFARAGIREVWIVNLAQRVVEIYREPKGETYASEERIQRGSVAALAFPDCKFALKEILG